MLPSTGIFTSHCPQGHVAATTGSSNGIFDAQE